MIDSRDIKTSNIRNQHGFTLLEVLIALLILSIGLLGLAALQTTSLRSNQMANMRTLATYLAYEMTDRMRANHDGVDLGQYTIPAGTAPATSPTTRAGEDILEWRNSIETRLPGGTGSIALCAGCDPRIHTITVYWNQNRDPLVTETKNCPPQNANDLNCYRLVFSE